MWHCEWQQFLFKGGNFQNLAKCKCYANYFIIVLPAKRKEQNSRQKKNKPFCRSSILANARHRQTTRLHTAAASWGHRNFASATDLQHFATTKASRRYRWHCTRIRGTEALGEVMVDTLGRETWWRSQHVSVATNSSSPIPIPDQQERASPVLCQSQPSPSPSLYLSFAAAEEKELAPLGFVCAIGKPWAGSNQT